jgi:hypothetical protein
MNSTSNAPSQFLHQNTLAPDRLDFQGDISEYFRPLGLFQITLVQSSGVNGIGWCYP